jgi:hypothetical protein
MAVPTIVQAVFANNFPASTTVTSSTITAATAGNLLVFFIAGDKNTGACTPPGGWTKPVELTSASVSLYVMFGTAAGGETSVAATLASTGGTNGNTSALFELSEAGSGAWGLAATTATNITSESTVTTTNTGTTGAATRDGLALACIACDSAGNISTGTWTSVACTNQIDAPSTSGNGGGGAAIHVGSASVTAPATTISTWTTTSGSADQISAAMVVLSRTPALGVATAGVATGTGTAFAADADFPIPPDPTIAAVRTQAIPLAVRIKSSRTDVHIETQTRDVTFRTLVPGGFASASFTLDRPLSAQPDDVMLFANVYIYDTRHGGVIWEGWLEDPGRGASETGETWEITAMGPAAHTRDTFAPYIIVDRSLERWHRSRYSTRAAKTELGEYPEDTTEADPALEIYAEEGVTVPTSWKGDWIYRSLYYAGQFVARVRADHVEDGASSNYHVAVFGRVADATANWGKTWNWVTTPGIIGAQVGDTDDGVNVWGTSTNVVSIRAQRDVSSTPADAFARAHFWDVIVRAVLKNADGTTITSSSSYLVNNVDPVEVIADMLGRFLPKYDGANAVLIGSGVDIDQLAYPDGVSPDQVLDDLMVYDPGFKWAAWESNEAGKYRFEYTPWPTTVRYDATTIDGFDSPGSASDLYNRVHVRWRDQTGRIRNTIRTQSVPELTAAGITRGYWIDLSDETGSSLNAIYVGDNFLAEHRYPPNAGTLTVARPILDNDTGRMVQPWEILPGYLIRVGGVAPRIDSLNPTARDGVTVFKVVSMEYSTSNASASLELDSFSRTVARSLASLKARRLRKR